MLAGLRAGWRAMLHLNQRGHKYIWGNLLWVALSIPIVTAPAAWMAFVRLGYSLHRDPGTTMDEFWAGFRKNWRRGIVLALINAVILIVNISNLLSYWYTPGVVAMFLRVTWLIVLVGWFALQLYAYPLFFALEKPTLVAAFRNAAVMILLNPLFTAGVLLCAALILVLSMALPPAWILLTGAALCALANTAVQDRLRAAGLEKTPPPDPDDVPDRSFYADYET